MPRRNLSPKVIESPSLAPPEDEFVSSESGAQRAITLSLSQREAQTKPLSFGLFLCAYESSGSFSDAVTETNDDEAYAMGLRQSTFKLISPRMHIALSPGYTRILIATFDPPRCSFVYVVRAERRSVLSFYLLTLVTLAGGQFAEIAISNNGERVKGILWRREEAGC